MSQKSIFLGCMIRTFNLPVLCRGKGFFRLLKVKKENGFFKNID